jgi:hypothetical protein
MNELNHTNGKGDKDRSPGWRDHYSEIKFTAAEGFFRVGPNRIRKRYGTRIERREPVAAGEIGSQEWMKALLHQNEKSTDTGNTETLPAVPPCECDVPCGCGGGTEYQG